MTNPETNFKYQKESNYLGIPLALKGKVKLKKGWNLQSTLGFTPHIKGKQKTTSVYHCNFIYPTPFGDYPISINERETKKTHNKGYSANASLTINKETGKWNLSITPSVEYFNRGKIKKDSLPGDIGPKPFGSDSLSPSLSIELTY